MKVSQYYIEKLSKLWMGRSRIFIFIHNYMHNCLTEGYYKNSYLSAITVKNK